MNTKKNILSLFLLCSFLITAQNEYYELRTYIIPYNGAEKGLHNYLSKSLLPALNRQGVQHIGVFGTIGQPTPKELILLIPYNDIITYAKVLKGLTKDNVFQENKIGYDSITVSRPAYTRFTSSFYIAFDGLPKLVVPEKGAQLFELRTYEGYSEDAVQRKTNMFNDGELTIFKDTGLHSVFFGSQVSGPLMPALTYMLAFKDMDERDRNWNKFSIHPEWKRISILPEYANTVSDIKRVFLKPLRYSQL